MKIFENIIIAVLIISSSWIGGGFIFVLTPFPSFPLMESIYIATGAFILGLVLIMVHEILDERRRKKQSLLWQKEWLSSRK